MNLGKSQEEETGGERHEEPDATLERERKGQKQGARPW